MARLALNVAAGARSGALGIGIDMRAAEFGQPRFAVGRKTFSLNAAASAVVTTPISRRSG